MPTLLSRLKLLFRQRSRQNYSTKTSPIHQGSGRPSAAHEVDGSSKEQPHMRRSPSPLPVITDSGPPVAHRYENEDIFWNSTMVEADSDPEEFQARSRRQTRRSASQDSFDAVRLDVRGQAKSSEPGSVRAEVKHSSPNKHLGAGVGIKQHSTAFNNLTRKDTDITVMLARFPEPPSSPPKPPAPQKPLTPNTEEWDVFMDFPSEYSSHIYSNTYGNQCIVLPKYTNGEKGATAASTSTNGNHSSLSSTTRSYYVPNGAPEALPREEKLTWNLALHQILEHDCVDPAMKQVIRERIRDSEATNGSGDGDITIISAVAAGLVPNFSYPIDGSEFYDRIPAEFSKNPSLNNGIVDCNGDNGTQGTKAKLANGVKPNNTSSKWSTDTEFDESDYASTLSSEPPDRVFFLLSSQLTPSELSLYHRVLNIVPPTSSAPFPATTPPSNASSSTPRDERLIYKLHDTIKGLQDRVSGLEDTLVPQLSTWLEQRSVMIEDLKVDLAILNTETANLKRTIDFGNRILGGCWEREGELWYTLNELCEKRSKGLLRRLTRRNRDAHNGKTNDANTPTPVCQNCYSSAAETIAEPDAATPRTTTSEATLSKRELDALLDIAAQNLRVLKEDIDDMVVLVQGCKTMAERVREIDAVEGSFRDV